MTVEFQRRLSNPLCRNAITRWADLGEDYSPESRLYTGIEEPAEPQAMPVVTLFPSDAKVTTNEHFQIGGFPSQLIGAAGQTLGRYFFPNAYGGDFLVLTSLLPASFQGLSHSIKQFAWAQAVDRIKNVPSGALIADQLANIWQLAAEEDPDGGEPVSQSSLECLELYLSILPFSRAPIVSCTPRGNLYLRWKASTGQVWGVEFLPELFVSYTFLLPPEKGKPRTCHYGLSAPKDLVPLVEAFNLNALLMNQDAVA